MRGEGARRVGRIDAVAEMRVVAAERADDAERAGLGAQAFEEAHLAVHHVAAERTAEERHAPGHARQRVEAEAERCGARLDGEGKAGVDVDVVELVGADAGELEHALRGELLTGMMVERDPLLQPRAEAHLGRRAQVDPLRGRHAEAIRGLRRADDERGALVDGDVRGHELRVRIVDHAVARAGIADRLGVEGLADPGVRIFAGDPAHARLQDGEPIAMGHRRLAAGPAKRRLAESEHRGRADDPGALLFVHPDVVEASDLLVGRARGRVVPGGLETAPLEAPSTVLALAAREGDDVEPARLDLAAASVDEDLDDVARQGAQHRARAGRAEALGQLAAGIGVSPDPLRYGDRVERADEGRRARIRRRGADRSFHEVEGREGEARIVELLAGLRDAHDDGASVRLGGHGISCVACARIGGGAISGAASG
jgi:hypothetical protein